MRSQLTEASATSDNTLAMNQLRELDETMKILGSGVQGLHEETRQQLSDDLPEHERKLRELIEKVSKVADGIEEEYGLLGEPIQNMQNFNRTLMELAESVDDMQTVSHDGTLVWKITGVAEKLRECIIFPHQIVVRRFVIEELKIQTSALVKQLLLSDISCDNYFLDDLLRVIIYFDCFCRRCSIRTTNIDLFTSILFIINRIQNASSTVSAR